MLRNRVFHVFFNNTNVKSIFVECANTIYTESLLLYEKMNQDDFKQVLGIVLTNEPASMDAYEMFLNLNQTSKITREVVQYSLQHKTWTKEYFERAHVFEDTVAAVGITPETLDEIVKNLREFQSVLSVQINVFKALADFTKNRGPCSYDILDELVSQNIARHRSTSAFDLHVAYCTILMHESRSIYIDCYNKDILTSNIDGLFDLMVLHRKKPDLRLNISLCEFLVTQCIYSKEHRYRLVQFLLDQIANTHGITALTSMKTLDNACGRYQICGIREDFMLLNGIEVIFNYIRTDFVGTGHLERKKLIQNLAAEIFWICSGARGSRPKMFESFFKITISQESVFWSLMTNDQKDNFHLAELQNNIHAYWMILTIMKYSAVLLHPMFSELQVENVLDLMERDFKSTQALLYLVGMLYCLLKYDRENIYAKMLLKTRHLNRLIKIYILDHKYNPNLNEALNMVMYYLHEKCDDLEKCGEIAGCSLDNQIFERRKTSWVHKFATFSVEEPEETLSEHQKRHNLVYLRWKGLKPFHALNDDSDEDSDDSDNDTASNRDSNDDSLSEASSVSDNIVSSDSEDGAGHHFSRRSSDYGDNDSNSDLSEASSMSEDSEEDARSSCYADSDSEDKEDASS